MTVIETELNYLIVPQAQLRDAPPMSINRNCQIFSSFRNKVGNWLSPRLHHWGLDIAIQRDLGSFGSTVLFQACP